MSCCERENKRFYTGNLSTCIDCKKDKSRQQYRKIAPNCKTETIYLTRFNTLSEEIKNDIIKKREEKTSLAKISKLYDLPYKTVKEWKLRKLIN